MTMAIAESLLHQPNRPRPADRTRGTASTYHGGQTAPLTRPVARSRVQTRLRVAPPRQRAARYIVVFVAMLVVLMIGAVILHTRLAERQIRIDQYERSVTEAQERFDLLRQQRAELRAPERLAPAANELGMAASPSSEFVTIDPMVLARTLAAGGPIDGETGTVIDDPLDQFREVKEVMDGRS